MELQCMHCAIMPQIVCVASITKSSMLLLLLLSYLLRTFWPWHVFCMPRQHLQRNFRCILGTVCTCNAAVMSKLQSWARQCLILMRLRPRLRLSSSAGACTRARERCQSNPSSPAGQQPQAVHSSWIGVCLSVRMCTEQASDSGGQA